MCRHEAVDRNLRLGRQCSFDLLIFIFS